MNDDINGMKFSNTFGWLFCYNARDYERQGGSIRDEFKVD